MNFSKNLLTTCLATTLFAASGSVLAQAATPQAKPAATAGVAAGSEMSQGTVRKIDKEQGKVTLKHGEIKNLDMPPMTMVFAVKDKAMLENINAGDKVRFRAVDENGKITVHELLIDK